MFFNLPDDVIDSPVISAVSTIFRYIWSDGVCS